MYFCLRNYNGDNQYTWIPNVAANETYTVSNEGLIPCESRLVEIPVDINLVYYYLSGYPEGDDHYHGHYLFDYQSINGGIDSNYIRLTYPNNFSDFRTSCYLYSDDGSTIWYQTDYGDIPQAITKMNGYVQVDNSSPRAFEMTTLGEFDEIYSTWNYTDDNKGYVWVLFGPSDLTHYSIPKIPDLVTQFLPHITRDVFNLAKVNISDVEGFSNYNEYVSLLFKSDEYFYNVVDKARFKTFIYDNGYRMDHRKINYQFSNIEQRH